MIVTASDQLDSRGFVGSLGLYSAALGSARETARLDQLPRAPFSQGGEGFFHPEAPERARNLG